MDVRDARAADLPQVGAIYAEAAATSPATFDLEGPPLAVWEETLAKCDPAECLLLLVAVEGETVLGFGKSGLFRERPAYRTTRETSVYVATDARGRGVGNAIYAALLERLDGSGLRLAVGGVTQPNEASDRLHRRHGFTEVGTFTGVGVKFGRAWDVRWFQRPLRGAPPLD